MADRTLDETLAAVQAADAGADSVLALVASLKQQVQDALGKAITPDMQNKINQIFDISSADAAKLNAATQAPAGAPVNQ